MGTNGSTMLEPLRQGPPPMDPASALGSAACSLSARYEAVRGARQFTGSTLKGWDLHDHFDDVALVVSELVTNALRHALPDEPARETCLPPVRLHLMRWTGRLVVAVRDPSAQGPGSGAAVRPGAYGGPGHDSGTGSGGSTRSGPTRMGTLDRLEELDDVEGFDSPFPDPDGTAESGRGLFLVDAYADSWGWHPLAGALHGKVVWALFRLA
ncbi:ATP-binding protein [Streptomyces sp. NPDC058953]|uniref:ATP-binding protein n=1 Tax=unclassified Streptomyces TaxID=2593676 RepID=UPI0036AC91D2